MLCWPRKRQPGPTELVTKVRITRVRSPARAGSLRVRRRVGLRPDRSVEIRRVPAAQRDLLHDLTGNRRVDQHAAADVHPDMLVAVEPEDVSRLKLTGRDRRKPGHLIEADARDRHAGRGPRGLDQPGAIEALVARYGTAPHVRAAELVVRELHRRRGRAADRHRAGGWAGSWAGSWAGGWAGGWASGARRLAGAGTHPLRRGEPCEQRPLLGERLFQRVLLAGQLALQRRLRVLGAARRLLRAAELVRGREEPAHRGVAGRRQLLQDRGLVEDLLRVTRGEQHPRRR